MLALSIIGSICFISAVFTIAMVINGGFFSKLIGFILSVVFINANVTFATEDILVGRIILNGIPIILVIIVIILMIASGGSNSSGGTSIISHMENRKNYPNKCISCTNYLSRGVCRQTGQPTGEMNSCSDWY